MVLVKIFLELSYVELGKHWLPNWKWIIMKLEEC